MVLSRASSCSLWSGEVPVSMISLVLKRHVRPYQRRCRDVLLNGGSPSSGSTATMTTSSGWCVQGSGVWGGGVTGGGRTRCPASPNESHSRPRPFLSDRLARRGSQDAIFFSASPIRDPIYGNRATRFPHCLRATRYSSPVCCYCFRSALFWLLQLEIQCIDILQPLSTAPILRRPQRAEPAVVFARSIASI